MDDRIRGEFEQERRGAQNGSYEAKKMNSKAGEFKISIDYDDGYANGTAYGGNNPRNFSASANSQRPDGKFQVSIPQQENRKPTYRPSAESYYSVKKSQASSPSSRPTANASEPRRPSAPPIKPSAASARPGAASNRPPVSRTSSKVPSKPTSKTPSKASKKSSSSGASGAKKASSSKRPKTKMTAKELEARRLLRKKSFLTFCVCLIIIAIITTTASAIALSTINDILAINKESTEAVSVYVPEGAGFNEVFDALSDAGLIKQKFICKLFCKFRDYDNYTVTDKKTKEKKKVDVEYVAGVYYFETDEGVETMLESMKASRNVSKDTVRVTFPEGWTVAQIFAKIEKYNVCTAEKLYANLEIVGKQFGFYEDITANSGRYLKAEGYLFPDTYDFYIGESANSVLKKLFSNFESKWTKEFDNKLKESGMTKDEIIILASIIQREAKDKTQMADISSVIHNRLKSYPQLQMNSTKDYITATNEYGVFSDFYYSLYLDSYNTYNSEGLPPGAICNPGLDAIEAALNPKDTNYYFFCHDKNGDIYLASTADEHAANTRKIFNESD